MNDVSFQWSGQDDDTDSYQLRYSFKLEGSDPQCHDWTNPYQQLTYTTYTDLQDGQYTFKVRAMDTGGNIDPSPAENTFIVDYEPAPGGKPKEPHQQE